MTTTPQKYQQMADNAVPPTAKFQTLFRSFLVGGLICTLGQELLNLYAIIGLDQTASGSMTSVSLIFLSALLTGLGIYDKIAKFGGAGTLVPITGFANAMVSPALEFKPEGMILGVGAKLFAIAGPVIVYGVCASVLYGVLYWIFKVI